MPKKKAKKPASKQGASAPGKKEKEFTREYFVIEPFARIKIMMKGQSYVYNLIEPDLGSLKKDFEKIKEIMISDIEFSVEEVKDPEDYLIKKMDEIIKKENISVSPEDRDKFIYYLKNEFIGLGKLEPLLQDKDIEDISCNGPGIPIYIRHRVLGSLESNILFNEQELNSYVMRIAQKCNRFISYAQPLLDGSLPDGSRVQATFGGGVSIKGPNFTIRRFRSTPLSPLDLIELNTGSYELFAYFWEAIENGMSILVSGGTATGKTSFLNALALFIPPSLKVVSIEDTPEINIPHENWIQSVSRAGYGAENYGEVTMFDLLKASFRQRPDYIILGEVRGQEAYVLFQSMASGHPGLGTIHAESADAIVERLLSPPINLSPALMELLDVACILVFAPKISHNARRVKEVIEILSVSPEGQLRSNTAYRWVPIDDEFEMVGSSNVVAKISRMRGKTEDEIWEEIREKEALLKKMKEKASNYREFFDLMSLYYAEKATLLKKLGL
ncbi:MAG: type II/IV secretion system ATPase subunit [archaeon]